MADNNKMKSTSGSSKKDISITKRTLDQIAQLNKASRSMMDQIKAYPLTRGQKHDRELAELRKEIDATIDTETDRLVSATNNGKDIALFLNNTFTKAKGKGVNLRGLMQNQTLEELMNDPKGQFDLILSSRYKNVNSLYEDIRLVTEQVSEMAEVIDTFRDSIVTSDNLISDISRTLRFDSISNASGDNGSRLVEIVKNMEEDTGIKDKLKKIIIPETLRYGNFFVFTQPYTDLFAKFKAMDDRYKLRGGPVNTPSMLLRESYTPTTEDTNILTHVYEEFKSDFDSSVKMLQLNSKDPGTINSSDKFISAFEQYMTENVGVINDPMVPLLEDSDVSALASPDVRNSIIKAIKKKKTEKNWNPIKSSNGEGQKYTDGVMNMSGANLEEDTKRYKKEFGEIGGCFMKLYDPRRVIPIYVMDYCIGYYVLYEVNQASETNILNSVHSISRTTMLFRDDKKKEFESKFISLIADRICRSIDKDFLRQNSEFKELIANAIAYDNFYQKAFRVQFVPSNYMTHFKINENYDTHFGTSVLYRSMFYAMLYLLMLLYTILIKVTRGSDLRMFLIRGNGTNKDISGKMNAIISDFKQKQISYNDFGSVRGILSKVGHGKDIGVPVGANGERAFDIEQLPGVDVNMDDDLMQLLRKAMISTTGCPSAMINYLEEVDFAKQISQLHSKFLARCVMYQEETEVIVTELYQKLLSYGDYNLSDEDLARFHFEWSRPRTLNTQNMNELISNADQWAEFLVKVFEGDNSVNDARVKDRLFSWFVRTKLMNGVIDWENLEREIEPVLLQLRADLKEEEESKIQGEDQ